MYFTVNDFIDLLAGRRGDLQVGTLPLEARKHFRSSREAVYLSTYSARHIFTKHADHLAHEDVLRLPEALRIGLWIADRELGCSVWYQVPKSQQRFRVGVKITADRTRAFISTFHRQKKRQTKSAMKRGVVLRHHWTV